MSKILTPIRNLFRYHKLKMVTVVLFALAFTLLIFPYDDLADLATAKISQLTNNSVYLQFNSLDLGLFPPGLGMEDVVVETQTLPAVKASRVSVSPLIGSLIVGRPGGSVDAQNLFGGAVAADYHEGEKLKSGERMKTIAVDAKGLKLPALATFLRDGNLATLLVQGTLNLSTQMQFDPLFDTQPNGEVGLKIDNFILPSQLVPVSMSPGAPAMQVAMPELKLGLTKLAAKMENGNLQISDFSFGNSTTISGKISGTVGVTFRRSSAGVQPIVGGYDLRVNLKLPPDFARTNQQGLGFAYGLMPPAAHKETPQGVELAFRLQPPAPGQGLPQITALQ